MWKKGSKKKLATSLTQPKHEQGTQKCCLQQCVQHTRKPRIKQKYQWEKGIWKYWTILNLGLQNNYFLSLSLSYCRKTPAMAEEQTSISVLWTNRILDIFVGCERTSTVDNQIIKNLIYKSWRKNLFKNYTYRYDECKY